MTTDVPSLAAGQARILVVEDDPVLRRHTVQTLTAAEGMTVIGEAATVAEAVALVALQPDLILLDLGLSDGSGRQVIEAVRQQPHPCRVLVITVFEDKASVLATLKAGADGYILKDTPADMVVEQVRATLAGETPISARAAGHLLSILRDDPAEADQEAAGPTLSPREHELLKLFARGFSRKEAARAVGLSPYTVAEYVQSIYRKLAVRSRGEAIYEAVQQRLIDLDRL